MVIIISWCTREQVRGPNIDMTIMKYHPYSHHVLYTGDKDLKSEKTEEMSHNGRCKHMYMDVVCTYTHC